MFIEPPPKEDLSSVGATLPDTVPDGAALPKDAIAKINAVAAAARDVRRVRAEALPKPKGGLRALYRTLELPGANPLKAAHAALDAAVLAATASTPRRICSPNSLP